MKERNTALVGSILEAASSKLDVKSHCRKISSGENFHFPMQNKNFRAFEKLFISRMRGRGARNLVPSRKRKRPDHRKVYKR